MKFLAVYLIGVCVLSLVIFPIFMSGWISGALRSNDIFGANVGMVCLILVEPLFFGSAILLAVKNFPKVLS